MSRRTPTIVTAAMALSVVAAGFHLFLENGSIASIEHASPEVAPPILERTYHFPLKLSPDRRYLVDQRGRPFLVVGDSPQAMIGNLSLRDAAAYIADRKRAGFDALWVDLLCVKYTGCRSDGTTFDAIRPFTKTNDLSTPNPAYFARADAMIRLAANAGMAVFLDPIETGGWLGVLRSNGVERDLAYGRFLGRHFARFKNIVWSSGNDFQTWENPSDDTVVLAVASGIHGTDPSALQTVELNYLRSASLDDTRWRPIISLDAAYTYDATYAEITQEYDRPQHLPVFMAEAGYEFEQNSPSISRGDPPILRRQEYWSALSGSAGQFYGNHFTWQFAPGWKSHLDTIGSMQLGFLTRLIEARPWFRLVPDERHRIVVSGYGTFDASINVGSSDYAATASTPDGRLVISYLPVGGTIVVDTDRLAFPLQAQWFDPTAGTYRPVAQYPLERSPRVHLTAPSRNAAGDGDWVLVLAQRQS